VGPKVPDRGSFSFPGKFRDKFPRKSIELNYIELIWRSFSDDVQYYRMTIHSKSRSKISVHPNLINTID
jgi:hypothetical protein